jgi:hypothetical protein
MLRNKKIKRDGTKVKLEESCFQKKNYEMCHGVLIFYEINNWVPLILKF